MNFCFALWLSNVFGGHQSIFKICVQPHSPHSVNSQGRFSTRWANTRACIHPWHRAGWNIYLTIAGAWGNTTRSGALWTKRCNEKSSTCRCIFASSLNYSLRDWQLILFVQIYLKKKNTHLCLMEQGLALFSNSCFTTTSFALFNKTKKFLGDSQVNKCSRPEQNKNGQGHYIRQLVFINVSTHVTVYNENNSISHFVDGCHCWSQTNLCTYRKEKSGFYWHNWDLNSRAELLWQQWGRFGDH